MSSQELPIVSIIMPAYNSGRWISRSLRSLQRQSFKKFEVIVVDDASEDKTVEIVGKSVQGDNRFYLVRLTQNSGPWKARKVGFQQSRGRWVSFLDADDEYCVEFLETMVDAAEFWQADIALCSAESYRRGPRRNVPRARFWVGAVVNGDVFSRFCRLHFGTGMMWNKIYRRDVLSKGLETVPKERVETGEDIIVNVGAFKAAERVCTLPQVLYLQHPQAGSLSARHGPLAVLGLLQGYANCLELFAEERDSVLNEIDMLYLRLGHLRCYRVKHKEWDRDSLAELYRLRQRIVRARSGKGCPGWVAGEREELAIRAEDRRNWFRKVLRASEIRHIFLSTIWFCGCSLSEWWARQWRSSFRRTE